MPVPYSLNPLGRSSKSYDGKDLYTITTTSASQTFTLPYAAADVVSVDWGDGKSDASLSHVYSAVGHYTIIVQTVVLVSAFSFNNKTGYACLNTVKRIGSGFSKLASFYRCFYNCSSLTAIPAGLFEDCPTVTNFSYCFSECTNLTGIPTGLFSNCPAVTNFNRCFYNCSSLTAIPAGLFDHCPAVMDFSYCFRYCSAITSAVPALWITHSTATGTSCFFYCTKAANYASIPSDWR